MPLAAFIESSVDNPLVWLGFVIFVLLASVVDLGLSRRAHGMTTRMALVWAGVWMAMALAFAGGVWHYLGPQSGEEFLAGYLLEKSLSVDNLFVFVLVFSHFKTPRSEQHRVLVWGIIGAMILRAIMILAGAALVARFEAVLLLFAAILLYSGLRLLLKGDDVEEDPANSALVRGVRRFMPITDGYRGHAFFVVEDGHRKATLLFLVLVVIEGSDVIFAVDSIPAIFGVTRDPFIVFTSNIFAILGLRALFFVIEAAIQRLRYLKVGLAFLLCFIAVKMSVPFVFEFAGHGLPAPGFLHDEWSVHVSPDMLHVEVDRHVKFPTLYSLLVIVAALGTTTAMSLLITPRRAPGADPLEKSTSGRLPVSEPTADGPDGAPAADTQQADAPATTGRKTDEGTP